MIIIYFSQFTCTEDTHAFMIKDFWYNSQMDMGGKAAHYHFCYTTIYPFILHPLRLYACIQSSLKRGSVYVKSFDILFSHSSLIAQPQRFPQGVARLSLQRAAELGDNAIRAFKTSLLPYINISSVYWIWPGAKVQRQISFLQLHVSQFLIVLVEVF